MYLICGWYNIVAAGLERLHYKVNVFVYYSKRIHYVLHLFAIHYVAHTETHTHTLRALCVRFPVVLFVVDDVDVVVCNVCVCNCFQLCLLGKIDDGEMASATCLLRVPLASLGTSACASAVYCCSFMNGSVMMSAIYGRLDG